MNWDITKILQLMPTLFLIIREDVHAPLDLHYRKTAFIGILMLLFRIYEKVFMSEFCLDTIYYWQPI